MKFALKLLLAAVLLFAFQVVAQTTETNNFADIKTKAEKGDATAQWMLGQMYQEGNGVWTNSEAVEWFRKAADQNNALGEFKLGEALYKGFGVPKNTDEALKWLRKSAEQGESSAQCLLGWIYDNGDGVTKNSSEAIKWYRKAAEQNDCDAQNHIGIAYENGIGARQDFIEAYKWFNLAAAQSAVYSRNRDSLASQMTPEQIAEAQILTRDFKPRKVPVSNSGREIADSNPTATGTGFFITDDGCIISNYHVVKGAAKVRLLTGPGLIDATVVKVDAANDLALLKAVGAFKPLPITASRTVKLGATVATVGFPDTGLQGFSPKLAKGEIGSLAGASDDPRYFQISVPVQPGNSGGALVDAHGNVVGIVAAKLSAKAALDATGSLPENVNYAVKSSLLLSFLESVPDVAAKLKEPNTKDESFEDVVKSAQDAAVLVLVY